MRNPRDNDWLPRLDNSFYQGHAVVFWTFVVHNRASDWLNPLFHAQFREILLHTYVRYQQMCAAYVLMPDHVHLMMLGLRPEADQRRAISFLRTFIKPTPHEWQHQPHDHVLREEERVRGAFQSIVHYLLQNPVRKNLVTHIDEWPHTGCMLPGYPKLHPTEPGYWDKFWTAYWNARNA